uniref:Uncharacterized protein n=1 Tax=Caenorhabditis tropicalis TaxID=1561998 RepID=A0A1I7V054_9PELO
MEGNRSEVKEEEIDYDDVPNEIVESNGTSVESPSRQNESLQPKTSRKRKRKSDFRSALDRTIKKGGIDLLAAGMAIQNAYETNQTGVPEEIGSFLTQNIMNVPFPQMPDALQMNTTPNSFQAMVHGYGLAAQMALMAANNTSRTYRAIALPKDSFNCVCDHPDRVVSIFNYPSEAPFSGEPIRIDLISMLESSTPAHVRLQNYLFQLLGKACINQKDIQRFWNIPGEKNHRYGNPSMFPKDLFDNLKQIFLEFFQLDYEELDHLSYSDSFADIEILKHLTVHETKNKLLKILLQRKKFIKLQFFFSKSKQHCKKELRHATFVNNEETPGGYFVKRQRHIPKRELNNGNEQTPEELQN